MNCLMGLFIGCVFLIKDFDCIVFLSLIYIVIVFVARCLANYMINFIDVNDYVRSVHPKHNELNKQIVAGILSIEYNAWTNVVTVYRDKKTRMATKKYIIKFLCKKYFNTVLCWDVFYYMYPLQIDFRNYKQRGWGIFGFTF